MIITLAAESRIVNRAIPRIAARNRQTFPSEKQKMSRIAVKQNRGRSIQNRHPNRILSMLKGILELHDLNRTSLNRSILDSDRIADSVHLLREKCAFAYFFRRSFWNRGKPTFCADYFLIDFWVHAHGGFINGGVACVCAKWLVLAPFCAFLSFFVYLRFCHQKWPEKSANWRIIVQIWNTPFSYTPRVTEIWALWLELKFTTLRHVLVLFKRQLT